MTRVASLGMYDLPWLHEATDALWRALRGALLQAGVPGVPLHLDRRRVLPDIWRDPALLLAQTCGYPLLRDLSEIVQSVAAPAYAFPGCDGMLHCSFVVVRVDDPARRVADLRGRRCAINGRDSNTGMNLLRAAVAPWAQARRFFAEVIETGAHLHSLRAVQNGEADVAAIDCVTHGLAARDCPHLLAGTRVLAQTAVTPGLPFVTARATSPAELTILRGVLEHVAADPAARALGWAGIVPVAFETYAPVAERERAAAIAGYPVLA